MNLETLINPTARQREFLQAVADKDYVLYGGAAGGGKSYILRWWLVLFLVWLYRTFGLRNVQVGLFCEDYPSLYDRQISKIIYEFPAELGELKQGITKNFQLRPEHGGGTIALRNLDDPSKYQSAEFAAMAVDELTKNSKSTFDFLRFRLRWPGVERPKFAAGANPGGPGHEWVKSLWIDGEFPTELQPFKKQFAFIQSKATDNPYLTADYYRNLQSLPPDLAAMFADGSWEIFAGKYFDVFRQGLHVLNLRTDPKAVIWEPYQAVWAGWDWGIAHANAIYLFTRALVRMQPDEDYRLKTVCFGEVVERGKDQAVMVGLLKAKCKYPDGRPAKLSAIYFSHEKFSRVMEMHAPADVLNHLLQASGLPPTSMATRDRIASASFCYHLFQTNDIVILDTCPKVIKALPTLVRNEDQLDDVLKVDNEADDCYDAFRYGVFGQLGPRNKPQAEIDRERIEAISDPFQKRMAQFKVTMDRSAKFDRRPAWERRIKVPA